VFSFIHINLSGRNDPNQNEIQNKCITIKICAENPFKVECPTITKDNRIKITPIDFAKLKKVLLPKIDIIITKKPTLKSKADLPDKVSNDNNISETLMALESSPPRFPATDKKAIKPIKKPDIDTFFIRLSQYLANSLSKNLLK
tara:strand:- start:38 stop:469 length:432 start_codon:yes stop_codon:yes gene_type:complete